MLKYSAVRRPPRRPGPGVVEEKEESSTPPPTGPDRMTLTNVTEKVTGKLSDKQRKEQYVDFSSMSKVVDDKDDDRGYEYVDLSSFQVE